VCGLEDLQDHRDDCTYVPYLSPRLKAASRSPGSLELVPTERVSRRYSATRPLVVRFERTISVGHV
jgi:hypothetical protein